MQRLMTKSVNENSFWLSWTKGQDMPYCYDNHAAAKAKALETAKAKPDQIVYLLKAEVVGTCVQPSQSCVLEGQMKHEPMAPAS